MMDENTVCREVDAVRTAVATPSLCTNETLITLQHLLNAQKPDQEAVKISAASSNKTIGRATSRIANKSTSGTSSKVTATATTRVTKKTTRPTTSRTTITRRALGKDESKESVSVFADTTSQLSDKEKQNLALDVVNSTLKVLTDTLKHKSQAQTSTSVAKRRLSSDLKQNEKASQGRDSPLVERPNQAAPVRTTSLPITSRLTSVAECCRLAFAFLRNLKPGEMPALKLLQGMNALIGKLVAHGMETLASKELRILKACLENRDSQSLHAASASERETLATLLSVKLHVSSKDHLQLLVLYHTHVLKLILNSRKPSVIESALEYLEPSNPLSPSATILESINHGEQKDKAAKQLEALSRILSSLCQSAPSSEATTVNGNTEASPDAAFKLQTMALVVRKQWWPLAGHKPDAVKEIYAPLSRVLDTFRRRSSQAASKKYHCARTVIGQLMSLEKTHSPSHSASPAVYSIFRTLSLLSQASSDTTDSLEFVELMADTCSKLEGACLLRLSCNLRSLILQLEACEKPPPSLEPLLHIIKSELHESLDLRQGFEIFFSEIVALRISAVKLLTKHSRTGSPDNPAENLDIVCEIVSVCVRAQVLILRQQSLEDNPNLSHIIGQSINSFLLASKFILRAPGQTPTFMVSALFDCCVLAKEIHNEDSYFVNISNIYWLCYQRSASNDSCPTPEALEMLRSSVNLLRERTIQEQKLGLLAVKLEKLGAVLTTSEKYSEASIMFAEAIRVRLELGLSTTLLELARGRPLRAAIGVESDIQPLFQSLQDFHRSAQQEGREFCYYDSDELQPLERTALFEAQMYLLELSMHSRSLRDKIRPTFEMLAKSLLEALTAENNPVRRAYCCTCLLRLAKENSNSFDQEFIQDALEYRFDISNLSDDQSLESFTLYAEASLKMAQALHENQPQHQEITAVQAAFQEIIEGSKTWQELENKVDDVETLILQLRTLQSLMALKGQDESCLEILRSLTKIHGLRDPRDFSESIFTASHLATTYLRMGYPGPASTALGQIETLIGRHTLSPLDKVQLQLVKGQISLTEGDLDTAKATVARAETLLKSLGPLSDSDKTRAQQLRADSAFVASSVYQLLGDMGMAFKYAKRCVAISQAMFSYLENKFVSRGSETPASSADMQALARHVEGLKISGSQDTQKDSATSTNFVHGPEFWTIIPAYLRNILHLYNMYLHSGHRLQAEYYAGKARKLASSVESTAVTIQVLTLDALHANAIGQMTPDLDLTSLIDLESAGNALETAKLQLVMGDMYAKCQSWSKANETYDAVDISAMQMLKRAHQDGVSEPPNKHASKPLARATSTKKRQDAVSKRPAPRKQGAASSKLKAGSRDDSITTLQESDSFTDRAPIMNLRAAALVQKANMFISQGLSSKAEEMLDQARLLVRRENQKVMQNVADARLLMLKSSEEAATDFTFNILPESTLSFPALSSMTRRKSHGDGPRSSVLSPPSKKNQQIQPLKRGGRKNQEASSFTASLFEARDRVWKLQSEVAQQESMQICYQICEMALQSTILLSAVDTDVPMPTLHPTRAALSMELPRIESVRRDIIITDLESEAPAKSDASYPSSDVGDSSLSAIKFQQDYIDIIPETWAAVSLSMSEDCSELYIVRYQAKRSPFIVRLPMIRHKLQELDDDEADDFDFDAGRAELREIIELSNFSCHESPDLSVKGASRKWWAEREALDLRMKQLLVNIESIWFGGFKGILSQHHRDSSLLARFRKSFEGILDRHLPSRQGTKTQSKKLTLDSNVLQLFIGLGDDQEGEVDIDEQLMDLLYFVIDVLQFNGERNAFDEVDFDSIATETLDALRAYHEAASSNEDGEDGHLILILDKRLHAFPWESMPCLENVNVSRVGSMLSLRERILAMRRQCAEANDVDRDMFLTERNSGTYILNPGSDLVSTQTTLEPLLESISTKALQSSSSTSTCSGWKAMVNHVPSETEFTTALSTSNMLLYFGHGSGNQYVRNRSIKRLDACSDVVWLMGCSSGTVQENGAFEPTSVPLSYLAAGCRVHSLSPSSTDDSSLPSTDTAVSDKNKDEAKVETENGQGLEKLTASEIDTDERKGLCMSVIATLWDVTDKDIDRFSVSVGEEWGLWDDALTSALASASASSSLSMLTAKKTSKKKNTSSSRARSGGSIPKTPAKRSKNDSSDDDGDDGVNRPKTPNNTKTPSGRKTPATRGRSRSAKRGGGEKNDMDGENGDKNKIKNKKSLVQAVVKARDACNLRYLNGAATVVYGVPVYLA